MSDPVHELYQACPYPAVSHPSTDPAVTRVAAKLAGLDVQPPSQARILEIGCASGHNLMPLAARWPESRFVGIDFSTQAIKEARETAHLGGLSNIEFVETDLRTFDPGDETGFDFIIAHGVYSWVPEDVRQALLDLCHAHLAPDGVALISYNTLPGWSLRRTLIDLTRQLSGTGLAGNSTEEILGILALSAGNHTPYARHLTATLHDLFGKGDAALAFDELGPVNHAVSFSDFVGHADRSGLRYLGDSRRSEDFPSSLAPESMEILKLLGGDFRALQQTIDVLTNRTFRSSLLCRAEASVADRGNPAGILKFAVRCPHKAERQTNFVRLLDSLDRELARFEQPLAVAFFLALARTRQETLPFHEVITHMAEFLNEPFDFSRHLPELARLVDESEKRDLISIRDEPVRFNASPPERPKLGILNLSAARKGQPMVDLYHTSCSLDDPRKLALAAAMDGSRTADELAGLAKKFAPDFNIEAWMKHLASRGMFAG